MEMNNSTVGDEPTMNHLVILEDSAYVQNLAELCHTVMHDLRWSSQKKSSMLSADPLQTESCLRLFGPDYGDNMDAIWAFEQLYNQTLLSDQFHSTDDQLKPARSNINLGRCMHLYARMFYRKGPWFTIDDLFFRYYFNELYFDHNSTALGSATSINASVDSKSLQESIQIFFRDLQQLLHMGLIRTFQSEKECAFIIDDTSRNGYGILNQSDVTKVRQRLGMTSNGSSTQRKCSVKSKISTLGSKSAIKKMQGLEHSSILKYLTSQRTLSFSSTTSNSKSHTNLLPVIQHVNALILGTMCEKISTKISLNTGTSKKKEQGDIDVKSSIDTINIHKLSSMWGQIMSDLHLSNQGATNASSGICSCVRLKEEPLISLRRVSRLLVCAGAGPGAMRWDGSNAWISVDDTTPSEMMMMHKNVNSIPLKSPSNSNWHNVKFPGLMHRLGLQDSPFYNNYKPCMPSNIQQSKDTLGDDSSSSRRLAYIQVFHSYQDFKAWEECVDIRCWLDFLIETKSGCDILPKKFDFHSKEGREKYTTNFQLIIDRSCTSKHLLSKLLTETEATIASLSSISSNGIEFFSGTAATTEDIICYMAIICNYILLFQIERMENDEIMALITRPWLRHLHWQSVLAYILWNCVDLFEKKGMYHIAIWILESILFGCASSPVHRKINDMSLRSQRIRLSTTKQSYVQFLLSRRVRGKAFDRLQVDHGHFERKAKKEGGSVNADSIDECCFAQDFVTSDFDTKVKPNDTGDSRSSLIPNSNTSSSNMKTVLRRDNFLKKLKGVDAELASCASIPFSFLRKLARRRKVSISDALEDLWNMEMLELGIRLERESPVSLGSVVVLKSDVNSFSKKQISSSGWAPMTDFSVANSLTKNAESKVRKRCTYIGRESSETYGSHSLDVEELAMEEYFLGLLPDKSYDSSTVSIGGWKGWHDEGSFLRLLFRLLCTDSILGSDFQDVNIEIDVHSIHEYEQATIYISPYLSAPLDLHVGHSFYYTDADSENVLPARSFYERRKSLIEFFLNHLERLSTKEIIDLVHESVERTSTRSHPSSPTAESIRQVVHTCSAVAAGLGGRALVSIFRSFCFDFRHYSAGLPDLLLIRANYESESDPIDLGQWLGEVFSIDDKNLKFALDTIDTNDYLGCSDKEMKLKGNGQKLRSSLAPCTKLKEKLQLLHHGRKVEVKCMVVEVKSNSDSLDERQEDWLNIIDRAIPYHARVCKFTDSG